MLERASTRADMLPAAADTRGAKAGTAGAKVKGEAKTEFCLWMDEPNIEQDMDAWSAWFDNVQRARQVLEKAAASTPKRS